MPFPRWGFTLEVRVVLMVERHTVCAQWGVRDDTQGPSRVVGRPLCSRVVGQSGGGVHYVKTLTISMHFYGKSSNKEEGLLGSEQPNGIPQL